MKVLITKSDGTPTKSKVYAKQFLQEKGLTEELLIEENGQFFYEGVNEGIDNEENKKDSPKCTNLLPVSWDTPVFTGQNRTKLIIQGTGIEAVITAKHPAGQIRNTSAFEIAIGQENFIMSLDLVSKLFKVKE